MVYPAAMFAPQVSARGVPVAEFNMETTQATSKFRYRDYQGGKWEALSRFGHGHLKTFYCYVLIKKKKRLNLCFIWSVVAFLEEQNIVNCRLR